MAADIFEAPSYKEPAVYTRTGGGIIVRDAVCDLDDLLGASGGSPKPLELNDRIKFFKLPPDVKLKYARVDMEDLDSAASLTWSLRAYNGTTAKYFFVDSAVGQAQGFCTTDDTGDAAGVATGVQDAFDTNSAIGYVVPDDNYYIELICTAAPAGDGGGDGIRVVVEYESSLESGEGAFRS